MKTLLILVSMATYFLFASKVQAIEVNFDSLKKIVEEKNQRVVGHKLQLDGAQLREGALARSYLPNIKIAGGYESFDKGTLVSDEQPYYGVEGELNIFNGGNDYLENKVRQTLTEISKNKVKIVISEELSTARELYWKIIYLRQEKSLLAKMIKMNKQNLVSANKRVKSGVATPSDRLEFEMKGLDLGRKLARIEAEEKSLTYDLKVHLGVDIHEQINITGNLEHGDEWEQELQHTHRDHEFFVKPAELTVDTLTMKRQQANNSWRPKVDLYAGWYQFNQREEKPDQERERQESMVGVKLTMNLTDKLTKMSEVRALEADSGAAKAMSSHQKKENEAHIEKEFLELKLLHDQVHEFEKYITMAEKYFKATQKEYVRGAKNSPDVLSATEKLEEVMRTKYQQLREFQITRSRVLSKIGR